MTVDIVIEPPYEHGLVPGDVVRIWLGGTELLRINLVPLISAAPEAAARPDPPRPTPTFL